MGAAHLVGGTARRVGHSARDLDPALRRDGIGFTPARAGRRRGGQRVVGAGRTRSAGWSTRSSPAPSDGSAWPCPWSWSALGVRLLRHPQSGQANSRLGIGLAALTVSATGLVHLSQHLPDPTDGATRMRDAGGMIGFLASSPLAAAVTGYGAILLLLLVGGFGVLVITATPVHAIPDRLLEAARPAVPSRPGGTTDGQPGADLPPNGVKATPAARPGRAGLDAGSAPPARAAPPRATTTTGARAGDEAFETPLEKAEREPRAGRASPRPAQARAVGRPAAPARRPEHSATEEPALPAMGPAVVAHPAKAT